MAKINSFITYCFFAILLSLFITIPNSVEAQEAVFKSVTSINQKIVGGYETSTEEWPWMTALVHSGEDAFFGQFCGGSLISPEWVVTASHCVDGETSDQIEVLINQHDLTDIAEERIEVAQIYQYQDYNPETLDNDIALLRLVTPSTQQTIDVISSHDLNQLALPFTIATVIGYGDISPGYGRYSDVLMQVDVPILPNRISRRVYPRSFTKSMMSAGFREGGKDTCSGDSGGPLIVPNADDSAYVLAGITSWGEGCATPGYPGVYTRVALFTDWIDSIMNEQSQL